MEKKLINVEKMQAALRGGAEERDCFEQAFQLGRAALYMAEGGNLDELSDFARRKIEFYVFLYGDNWRKIALSAANQMIGAVSKLQRRTGLKVLTHFVSKDEERLILLREVCEAIEEYCASLLNGTYYGSDCLDLTVGEILEEEGNLEKEWVA